MATRIRAAVLAAVILTTLLAGPAAAAPAPRVMSMGALADRPVEVYVSSKQLTLIHFDPGDVSMVAVGDPALLNVAVKGPDVLVKANGFSGATNAFVWVGGAYAQFRMVVRESAADPRVIIVRESTSEATPTAPKPEGSKPGPVTVTQAYTPPPKPAAAPAPAPPKTVTLEEFIKSLNSKQLALFNEFLADPTIGKLSALMKGLTPAQRDQLTALLKANGGTLGKPPTQPPQAAPAPPAQPPQPAPPTPVPTQVTVAGVTTELPDGIAFVVSPQVLGNRVYLNYALQNEGDVTLLADITRLKLFDGAGNRLGFDVTRTSADGYIGRINAGSAETGIIKLAGPQKVVALEWTLTEVGSGALHVVKARIVLP